MSISFSLACFDAQATCGVMMQFSNSNNGLPDAGGSVFNTSKAANAGFFTFNPSFIPN